MLLQFLNHIDRNKIFNSLDKILLAVSGGVDSMVMLHLFKQSGASIGVVHCNFKLRGEESDRDASLVKEVCHEAGITFHQQDFNTNEYAEAHKVSIQMAARTLRYAYFNALCKDHGYHYIATAHHINDSLETVLLNMVRGTGMDGLKGISVKNGNIIRPLMFTTREKIEAYATSFQLQWREDASNASDKYYRNLLRNQVVPLLEKINPNLEEGFQYTLERIHGTSLLATASLTQFKAIAIRETGQQLLINRHKLRQQPAPTVVLWELIKDRGFNYVQCKDIMEADHQAGKLFYSATHQLTIDRENLIISARSQEQPQGISDILIDSDTTIAHRGVLKLTCEVVLQNDFKLQKGLTVAQLDFDLLSFPLTWRSWQPGDKFMPLGMSQTKKVSDFLIDSKVSLPEKDKITVLESAGKIIWVVGHRVSEEFKVKDHTINVFKAVLEG